MTPVAHPVCASCGRLHPDFESVQWGIRVCRPCLTSASHYFDAAGLLEDSHPLLTELFDGVFTGGTSPAANEFTIWVRSPHGENVWTDRRLKKYCLTPDHNHVI